MTTMVPMTETERYFLGEITPSLEADDPIEACAYLAPVFDAGPGVGAFLAAARERAAFIALTRRHLIFVWTRIGVGAPLRENLGVDIFDRTALVGAGLVAQRRLGTGKVLMLALADGATLRFHAQRTTRYVSSQLAFLDQLSSSALRTAAIEAEDDRARASRRSLWIMVALGAAVGFAFAAFSVAVTR